MFFYMPHCRPKFQRTEFQININYIVEYSYCQENSSIFFETNTNYTVYPDIVKLLLKAAAVFKINHPPATPDVNPSLKPIRLQ